MEEPTEVVPSDATATELGDSLPPGNHALEVAARAGFGPLSGRAQEVWHGQAVPCVSCGQLVHRDDPACEHCGQDLSEEMIRKMRQHAGPWFVLEHVRPFPGVSLERVVRQIRRGLITETSIVRGPSNDYQWRFAVETPGLCRYFGKCWCCHGVVTLSDTYCPNCLHYLSFEKPRPLSLVSGPDSRADSTVQAPAAAVAMARPIPPAVFPSSPSRPMAAIVASEPVRTAAAPYSTPVNRPAIAGARPETADLARLSAAVRQARVSRAESEWDQPPRVGGVNVSWIAALLIIGAVVALLLISRARSDRPASANPPSLPVMQPAPALQAPKSSASAPAAPPTASPSLPASPAPAPVRGTQPEPAQSPKPADSVPPAGTP